MHISRIRLEDDVSTDTFVQRDSRAAASVHDDIFYCALRSSRDSSEDYNNRMYILDNDAWTMDLIGDGTDAFTVGSPSATGFFKFLSRFYMISPNVQTISAVSTGVLRRLEIDAQFTENYGDGTAANVNASYLSKEFDFGKEVFVRSIFIYLRRQSEGTLTFGINADQRGETTSSIDVTAPDTGSTENASSSVMKKEVWLGQRCRTLQFRLHDRGNNDMEVYEVVADYVV